MSDKTSDKRYKITLTEKQLDLVGEAVEMMLQYGGKENRWMNL